MMKRLHGVAGLFLGGCAMALTAGGTPPRSSGPAVVGTFDSRALTIAYVASPAFTQYLDAQRADITHALERARAAGDLPVAEALDALGPAMQRRLHEQGFGTAPVDDILAHIEDELPGIAEEAGVDVIVSRWALAYQRPGTTFVDVTDLLAACFHPDEKTWKSIHAIVETDPVPLDAIEHEH
jgi:hypothetical protein